jgi:outer membrane protein assembly factor BamA
LVPSAGALVGALLIAAVVHAQPLETLGEVRVHGNHTTPDADVLALAGLEIGGPASDEVLRHAESRLRQSGRFADVEVRKRYRSIDNPSDILVILLVDEHPGVAPDDLTPGALRRFRGLGMWLPILDYTDGYGFTYGARLSFVDVLGPRSRVSVPASWGGERRVGVTVDRTFERGLFTRLEGGVALTRRENPRYVVGDRRTEGSVRVERAFTTWLRAGGDARLTQVAFGQFDERFAAAAIDLTMDTRTDPAFPRDAVHVVTGLERLAFAARPDVTRWSTDARGYLGLWRSAVVTARAALSRVNAPLPAYEQPLLGGASLLRGYEFGYRTGDALTALSAEVRVPLTSPLNVGKFGVKAFIDTAAAAPYGQPLSDQRFDRAIGGGVFVTAPVFRLDLDLAWPSERFGDSSRAPRWHFGLGVTF